MDVEDAHGLALEIVGRRHQQAASDPGDDEHQPDPEQPRRGGTGDLQEARGIGEDVHGPDASSEMIRVIASAAMLR